MNDIQRTIEQTLSLRTPQKESLDILAQILAKIAFSKDMDNEEALKLIQEIKPSVKDFERAFPCICFSIATGVGKTRLMGAMITYLHAECGIKNFMVLAPNLTIYNKLKKDFTPNTTKYVFPGLNEYVGNPQIITGDDYDQVGGLFYNPSDNHIKINIFNISKIDSDKDARGLPRVRRMAEYLGQSYFDYLSSLKDLVLIMDEAHRYRANAGMAAINELHPILGIELTATAKSTGSKGKLFRNIVYEYNLAHAIKDGYVKKPAVVGRSDFNKNLYGDSNSEELENLKIKDAIKIHESLKAELQVYADNNKTKLIKPFIMIIAENIKHAEDIEAKIKSDDFEEGHYKNKVIVVNSKQNGDLKDEVLQRLLAIENADEPTEIVIHVNMLGEGWDVNNLYTIVPLRAANSKILVEQSIGRGLRLPFGKLTKNDTLDRLHVVAHDKFSEIINAANNEQFEFQQEYIDNSDNGLFGKKVEDNLSKLDQYVENGDIIVKKQSTILDQSEFPVFTNELNKQIGEAIRDTINEQSKYILDPEELTSDEVQAKIVEAVKQKIQDIKFDNSSLLLEDHIDVEQTTKKYTDSFLKLSINIPRIKVSYDQDGDFYYENFDIDTKDFDGYEPIPQKVIISELIDISKRTEMQADFIDRYENIEEYLLVPLIEENAIAYNKMSDLLFKLISQVINHINSYSGSELNTRKILFFHAPEIEKKLYAQMKLHLHEAPYIMRVKVDSSYAPITLASYKISVQEGCENIDFRAIIKDKNRIRNMTFVGFNKCLFEKQKFDSCTEKDFAELLERTSNVLKWFKINNERAKEIFDIKYKNNKDGSYSSYLPDFIVETFDAKYMIETKAENEIDNKTVQAKKEAAVNWCSYATNFEREHGGKPWYYLLIPDTTIVADRSFEKLVADYKED